MVSLYRVGGSVRDEFLGVKSKDIDFAVEANSYEEMTDWIKANGKIYLEKPEYFTVRAKVDGVDADFVLCRKDGIYKDGRRPETVEVGDIYDDLARRDFTMNAIAVGKGGFDYIDPYNGQQDIKDRWIRCVGDPEKRFSEDGLRMLRAVRFAITKQMRLDDSIKKLLNDFDFVKENLKGISEDRIKDELNKCFMADTLSTFLDMIEYDVLFERIFMSTYVKLKATTEERF